MSLKQHMPVCGSLFNVADLGQLVINSRIGPTDRCSLPPRLLIEFPWTWFIGIPSSVSCIVDGPTVPVYATYVGRNSSQERSRTVNTS